MKPLFILLALVVPVAAQEATPLSVVKKDAPQTFDLNWESVSGKTYFIRVSFDMITWQYLPEVMAGVGGNDTLGFSSPSDQFFFRLIRSDLPTLDLISADHDGDGIPSFAELIVTNTDPVKFSTAGDGTSDRALFPSPANGIHLDSANSIQYSIAPDAGDATSAGRIVALHHFEAPDYRIEYQVGELNLEKHGFEPLVETADNAKKRYLSRLKGLGGQIKADNSTLTGVWQIGGNFFNGQRFVSASSDDQQITTVDPLNGNETVQGQISSTDPTLYIPPRFVAGDWDWNQETWRGEWFDPTGSGDLLYDIAPFHQFWDGGAWLYYEEYLSNENTMANVVSTAASNPPAYSSIWQEGNPWGIWDKWSSELGVSYRRFKFRITNKGVVDVENPALATVFFKSEGSNEVEEVMSVEWDGTNTSSPVYEVDPHQLKPNVDGTFYINAATMAFELDLTQKPNRLAGEKVVLFLPEPPTSQPSGFAGSSAAPEIAPPPEGAKLAQVKFPGMNDRWYKGSNITMSLVSGNGVFKMIAYDPDTGNQVVVPFYQNIANDFFQSKGAYHGWDWYLKAEQAGEVQVKITYTKGERVMELTRDAVIFPAPEKSPDVLAVNADFDEGHTGMVLAHGVAGGQRVGAQDDRQNQTLIAERASVDGRIKAGDLVTDDLHEGWFGINPDGMPEAFWDGATITINKIQRNDPVTGERETGEVRFYATWGNNQERYIEPYDWVRSVAELSYQPVNLVGSVYGSASTIPENATYWMEGVVAGQITLEFKITKGNLSFTHQETFEVCSKWTKDQWLNVVRDELYVESFTPSGGAQINGFSNTGIDIDQYVVGNGFLNNRHYIYSVYEYYAKLHLNNPQQFYWAGLAKLAGAPVYGGLSDAENGKLGVGIGSSGIVPSVTLTNIQNLLIQANINIYKDLAYQFVAYRASGIGAIEHLKDNGFIDEANLIAWNKINNGYETNNVSLIADGNEELLQREQQIILAQTYIGLNNLAFGYVSWMFSKLATNPIAGAPSFQTVVPGGNIAVFNDRWTWITHPTQGMWKLWTDKTSGERKNAASNNSLRTEADLRFRLLSPLR